MRKIFCFTICLLALYLFIDSRAMASEIYVYKNPHCGCCNKWISYIEEQGFAVKTENNAMLPSMKKAAGITPELESCHTAVIEGYLVEGHVPAGDIKRLLEERPDIKALAVPGMHLAPLEAPHPPARAAAGQVHAAVGGQRQDVLARGHFGIDSAVSAVDVDLGGDDAGADVAPILDHRRRCLVTRGFNGQYSCHRLYTSRNPIFLVPRSE